MMLTTKGRYAVMAMVDMAAQNRFLDGQKAVGLAHIAERQDITVAYLEQIFSKLKCAGLVKSVRGPGGGYVLARGVSEINISDIINAVEEQIKMVRCEKHKQAGHDEAKHKEHGCMGGKGKCATHDLWDGLGKRIEDYLESVTLEDIINNNINKMKQDKKPEQTYLA